MGSAVSAGRSAWGRWCTGVAVLESCGVYRLRCVGKAVFLVAVCGGCNARGYDTWGLQFIGVAVHYGCYVRELQCVGVGICVSCGV